jgi:DNA polymerase III alpha subunit
MIIDKLGLVYYTQDQVFELLYQNPNFDIDQLLHQDPATFNNSNRKLYTGYPKLKQYQPLDIDIKQFDQKNQAQWRMPEYYKNFDIENWLLNRCQTEQERDRVSLEIALFRETNLISLLCYLKYMVDVMTEKSLVWGVGRGSSTASYVLFLIGLHNIDSIKYDIPIEEFFKLGE